VETDRLLPMWIRDASGEGEQATDHDRQWRR